MVVMSTLKNKNQGITLIEVLVAVSILAVVSVFVGATVTQFTLTRNQILDETKKAYLAEEGYEILRYMKDDDWSSIDTLSFDTEYYFDISTTTLGIVSNPPEVIDGKFNRGFILQEVHRDGLDNIVASTTGGTTIDNDMKRVFVYVYDNNSTTTYEALLANLP